MFNSKIHAFIGYTSLAIAIFCLFTAFQRPTKQVRIAESHSSDYGFNCWNDATKTNSEFKSAHDLCQFMYQNGWVIKSTLHVHNSKSYIIFEK